MKNDVSQIVVLCILWIQRKQDYDPGIEGVYFVTRRDRHMTLFLSSYVLVAVPQDITLYALQAYLQCICGHSALLTLPLDEPCI